MATSKTKNGKRSAKERNQIEALPFVGRAKDGMRGDFWAVPKRGGYDGGCMTGWAAATAYLKFLHDNPREGCLTLQTIAFDMFGRPRSESRLGQAVGFFVELNRFLCEVAPFANVERDDDQIRREFERGLNMNRARTVAYWKELGLNVLPGYARHASRRGYRNKAP